MLFSSFVFFLCFWTTYDFPRVIPCIRRLERVQLKFSSLLFTKKKEKRKEKTFFSFLLEIFRKCSVVSPFWVSMAAAAQLHGSAAAAAAYRRTRPFAVSPSCRRLQNPLSGLPKISLSASGVGMELVDFHARVSAKSANENAQVENLNLQAHENVTPQKRSAKIHDFCLGIPFGGLLFTMGLLGYIFSKSTISLVLGVAPGFATLMLGALSLKFWRSGRSSVLFILAQGAISALLAWKYSHAYFLTNRLLPWGFYASLSTAMACFYAYVLLAGGNPPPKKLASAPPL